MASPVPVRPSLRMSGGALGLILSLVVVLGMILTRDPIVVRPTGSWPIAILGNLHPYYQVLMALGMVVIGLVLGNRLGCVLIVLAVVYLVLTGALVPAFMRVQPVSAQALSVRGPGLNTATLAYAIGPIGLIFGLWKVMS